VWRTWTATSAVKSVTIAFGPATHLQLEASSATPLAGEGDNLTITAKDASNNTVGTYSGSHSLIFEGAGEAPNGTKPIVTDEAGVEKKLTEATEITFTAGVGTVSGSNNGVMKLYKAEATHIKVKEGALNNGAGLAVSVTAGPSKKFTVPTPVEQTAGTAFNVTLTATDEWGNKTIGYTGSKTLVWSGPLNSPSGQAPSYPSTATTVTFTEGLGTASTITLYDALSTTLTAKEGTIAGTSAAFTVKAGTATRLGFTTSPSSPTAENTVFTTQPKVTVQDTWQNTVTTDKSEVTLTPSGATLTCTANPKKATAGVVTFAKCKMNTAGTYTLKATDGILTSALSSSFTIS
jgi:hypothetical protein